MSDLTNVKAVSAGDYYTIVLKDDDTLWSWGNNNYGQLGDGTTIGKITPLQVNVLTNVIAIDAGSGNAVALKNDGTVWSWGSNFYGEI